MTIQPAVLLPTFESASVPILATWTRVDGIEYVVPPSVSSTPFLLARRPWRSALVEALLEAARHGSSFVDIGAGFGYFTALVAKHVPQSASRAVESDPQLLELASINLENFPNAELLVGTVGTSGSNHPSESPTVTLLEVIEEYQADVLHVKAPGRESDVLASLNVDELLRNDLSIFLSVHPGTWPGGADAIRSVVAGLEQVGFATFFIHENRTLAAYTDDRLDRAIGSTTEWCGSIHMLIARGRYLDAVRTG